MKRKSYGSSFSILNSPIVRSLIRPVVSTSFMEKHLPEVAEGSNLVETQVQRPYVFSPSSDPDSESIGEDQKQREQRMRHAASDVQIEGEIRGEAEGSVHKPPADSATPSPFPGLPPVLVTSHEAGTSTSRAKSRSKRAKRQKKGHALVFYDDEDYLKEHADELYFGGWSTRVAPELAKYHKTRYSLFSRFDEGCCLDYEGWYSVTPEDIAIQTAERCKCNVIVDAFCGLGGNAIQFAMTCEHVIAIDNSELRLACAKRNARIYGVSDKITFIHADFVDWARQYIQGIANKEDLEYEVEVIFLSPPWGGLSYITSHSDVYPLSALQPIPGDELFKLVRAITPDIAMFLPRNTDVIELANLPSLAPYKEFLSEDTGLETVEVEQNFRGKHLKAITAYYGSLAVPFTEPGDNY